MILARLLSATPQTDGEHWDLAFRWHFDAWHTDVYQQNPAPYQRNPQLGTPPRVPYPWRPGLPVWGVHDALFPNLNGFEVAINTANSPLTVDISGQIPVNSLPVGFAPQAQRNAAVSTTGGSIPSGDYLISFSASQAGPVPIYMIRAVIPAGTTTGSIVISDVVWQYAAPNIQLYAGTSSLAMHTITPTGSWVGSSPDTYGNPTVFTITAIDPDGTGMPDTVFNSFLFQAKAIYHGGVWGDVATSIASVGGHATATNPAWAWGVNQWAGYILSRYDPGSLSGILNYLVASNTATTLTFAGIYGPPANVALVMRAKSGSITASTIGDANFANALGPAGLTVNAEVGRMVRIIAGTGQGQALKSILSNTATVLTIAGTWDVTPDSTSIFIVEDSGWRYPISSGTIVNGQAVSGGWMTTTPIVGSIPVVNFLFGSLLIEALTVDVNGNWSPERYAPIREIWVPPQTAPSSGATPATFAVPVAGGVASPDASQPNNLLVLTANTVLALPANVPVGGANAQWTLIAQQGTGTAVFAGSGLNDATSGGVFAPYVPGDTGSAPGGVGHLYVVTISATGTPDSFTWTKDGGAASSPVAITGAAQVLADGVTITFLATTGHTLLANWTVQVGGFVLDTTAYAQLPYGLSNAQSPAGTECIQTFTSNATGTRCPAAAQMNLPIT